MHCEERGVYMYSLSQLESKVARLSSCWQPHSGKFKATVREAQDVQVTTKNCDETDSMSLK